MIKVAIVNKVKAPITPGEAERVIRIAARYERLINGLIEISFVGDNAIRVLNRRYRGIDKPTDVLSFGWEEAKGKTKRRVAQLFLSPPYIRRQARRFKVAAREELIRMIIHGLLHSVGYDHQTDRPAARMFFLQEKIVTRALAVQ